MWYQIRQFIKFLLKSKNQHGVHSPFIFDFLTKCCYDRVRYNEYDLLDQFRKDLINNHSTIAITDFGAGSKILSTETRKISGIAKTAGITAHRSKLLFRIANYYKPVKILELGTSLGLGTSALHLGNPESKIITIEGCQETAQIAKNQFQNYQMENIDLRINNFKEELKTFKNQKFDLIYIDGNHRKNSTLNYFDTLINTVHNNSIIILDDIHWSEGMTEAWDTIKRHKKVTVSIDSFFWGIIFFRKEQVKQHFTIRL